MQVNEPKLVLQLKDVAKIETFTTLFQNIKSFNDHVIFNFDVGDGLFLQIMDVSKISVLEIRIAASWFSTYKCTQSLALGIHSILFSKILQARHKETDTMDIIYNPDKGEILLLK